MSSRKKITIAFIAVVLVVAAVTAAIVSVLAANKQTVKSGFKVYYNADGVVAAAVSAKYKQSPIITAKTQPAALTVSDTSIGSHTFARTDAQTEKALNDTAIEVGYDSTNLSIVYEFVFENKADSAFNAKLTIVDIKDKDSNTTTMAAENLGVKYYKDGSSGWVDLPTAGNTWNVASGIGTTVKVYVQVFVADANQKVESTSFNFQWDLNAVT